ncbi:retropepsin-like aspartic protease [Thiohalobacter sp. IOR34]|uniref:retropepsin-like aspartic protease family protein n=1 Tax=Thiohalobacter sp. IOR34 TaxID=3057176 RepID=UPI0025B061BD|nr:retropepsin-like aspartic protease [Thiohalobacter sp. IOR34]WJW76225.1 retropepsin-like aspartic protease [Thiohalobacter sp. IOR34]
MSWRPVAAVLLLALARSLPAADIEVLALFGERAMLRVDGVKHLLRVGESTPEGIRLLATDTAGALLRIDGREQRVPLGARARAVGGAGAAAAGGAEVVVWRDTHGMFRTVGSINGMPVDLLVDTGATFVTLSAVQARRLGIDFRVEGERGRVMTASRPELAYRVRLDRVRLGGIELRNVSAVVLDGPNPPLTLLGMSFLRRLQMENDGERLVLRRRY